MKKFLAVLLSAIMVFSVLPVLTFAAPVSNITESVEIEDEAAFNINGTTVIKSGVTVTIPDGVDVVLAAGNTVTVEAGASLIVLGTLRVEKGSTLTVYGKVGHSERVTALGNAKVVYTFTDVRANAFNKNMTVKAGYPVDGWDYADVNGNVIWSANLLAGGTFEVPLNSWLYIKTEFPLTTDGKVRYDNAKVQVFADGVKTTFKQGVHLMRAESAATITYCDLSNENNFLYGYKLYVPSGAGYTVYGYTGDTSSFGAITADAGSDFRFRIDIDKDYDMSAYELYYYEGYSFDQETGGSKVESGEAVLLVADNNGYYTISNIYSDYTIYVTGVVSNAAIEKSSSILDLLRNIMNIFKALFEKIAAFFGGAN